MKKAVLFLLVVILMIGACGCMGSEAKEALVQRHLENKYGEEFTVVSITDRNIDMPYDEVVVQNHSGEKFYAYIESKDGEQTVRDAYYGVLKLADYQAIVRGVLDRYFPDYKLFSGFTAGYFDNKYDGAYKLEDALKDNKAQFYTYTHVFIRNALAADLDENACEALAREFEEQGMTLHLVIYSVSEEQFLLVDEAEDVNKFIPDDYKEGLVFRKTIQ